MNETLSASTWMPQRLSFHELDALRNAHPELIVVDRYPELLQELFLLRNPKYRYDKNYAPALQAFRAEHAQGKDDTLCGEWFYYSWSNTLVHVLADQLHQELRTGRNRNLITRDEQSAYYQGTVAVLGLSVGSHVATTIAMTGGAMHLRLADPDTISGDNLNRIRAGYPAVGTKKSVLVARQIFEINPYADIRIYPDGLTEENLDAVLDGVDVVVEEMDNPFFKLKIREVARARGIPVVMGTDNGDGIITDVERFDLDAGRPILHGKLGRVTSSALRTMSPRDLPRVAARIAGADRAVPRMLESVTQVGQTLYSWPQLGTAANLCGTVVSYLVRRILLKDPLIRSGRYEVSLDAIFESGYERRWLSRKMAFLRFLKVMKGNN
ncbi:MAG: ThiF family adenylyltransferase [Myxococcales bacterium]